MIPGSLAVMSAAAPAAPTFNPATLFSSGQLGAWFDVSEWSSTAFQDTAGSTPVTATGQSIARLNDKSGRGNHVTQATAGLMPTLELSSGYYGMLFDGSNDTIRSSTVMVTMAATTSWEAFICIRMQSVTTNAGAGYDNNYLVGDLQGYWEVGYGRTTGVIGIGGGSGGGQTITQSASVTSRLVVHGRFDGTNTYISINGGTETSAAFSNYSTNVGGNFLCLGKGYGPATNGRVHEVILTTSAVSSTNRADCIAYLKSKWGV